MGKYLQYFADADIWHRVRVSECKHSGIAAACAAWHDACQLDPANIVLDADAMDAASRAIDEMSIALRRAKGKLAIAWVSHQITPAMTTSPYVKTDELLKDWQTALDAYQFRLIEAATNLKQTIDARRQVLKGLTMDGVLRDQNLWNDFLDFAAAQGSRQEAEAYKAYKEGRWERMLSYRDHLNFEGPRLDVLENHFVRHVPVTAQGPVTAMNLERARTHVADGWREMIESDADTVQPSMFRRFKLDKLRRLEDSLKRSYV